jgi:hypothetical protein
MHLMASSPNVAPTLTDSERTIMKAMPFAGGPYLQPGDMIVFGLTLTENHHYGLAAVGSDDEQPLCEFAAQDPVVRSGTEVRMRAGEETLA